MTDEPRSWTSEEIGQIAARVEGSMWNIYYARESTMKGAYLLASIQHAAVLNHPARQEAIVNICQEFLSDFLEQKFGKRPTWNPFIPTPTTTLKQ